MLFHPAAPVLTLALSDPTTKQAYQCAKFSESGRGICILPVARAPVEQMVVLESGSPPPSLAKLVATAPPTFIRTGGFCFSWDTLPCFSGLCELRFPRQAGLADPRTCHTFPACADYEGVCPPPTKLVSPQGECSSEKDCKFSKVVRAALG